MSVEEKFREHEIVPDVILNPPHKFLQVTFGTHHVNLGNILTPTQVKNQPTLVQWQADPSSFYTLIMTDPDAPSRQEPKNREWHHWMVINIPGANVHKGEVLAEYVGSGPPPGTGFHRYVFVVYKQPGKIFDVEHGRLSNRSMEGRGDFKTVAFAHKHRLGEPVAGNFYQAEYDDYCVQLYEQLSGK